ncbi:hypothetical protein C1637_12085 [Chryseobacterium lactis]|uniref:Uncharacterized protein n=1 Tax=Chryseobacterium lactis TaxID=1241981 RepID=A0A3G6RLH3_CHRLC|nr:hypothetical protein [Chryseobacterium lactis]AZA80733.1 hypothetical protein EG342_01855 [Chryseobacterium lactis]AZB05735.1 hypothetical protein EG341_17980 [Chryseobacterium lactis]PNW13546.1 hypothetical protein C1637_12085 [Chryseobacterium lactis]
MKSFIVLLLISSTSLFSQKIITPENVNIDQKMIKDETTESVWYAENAGQKIEIGSIITELKKLNKTDLLIKTMVKMKQMPDAKWTDSTIVKTANFLPSYHSSYNSMRDMVLKSGKNKVTGYYLDKKSGKKDLIDTEAVHYFDSSSYPILIRFLPLQENYSSEISIFDYNPKAEKNGVIKAYVTSVKKAEYKDKPVWAVQTTDDISNKTSTTTYYIDPETRKVVKQEMDMKGRKMFLEVIK